MSATNTFSQADLEAKLAEQKQTITAELETKAADAAKAQTAALEAKVAELSTATAKIAELEAKAAEAEKSHTAALEAKTAELQKAHADEKAKIEAEHAAKVAELESFDARKLGIAPVKIAHLQHERAGAAAGTPEAKLAALEKMPAGPEKAAYRQKHWNDLIKAEEARKAAQAQA